jgi:hypothetical protein
VQTKSADGKREVLVRPILTRGMNIGSTDANGDDPFDFIYGRFVYFVINYYCIVFYCASLARLHLPRLNRHASMLLILLLLLLCYCFSRLCHRYSFHD